MVTEGFYRGFFTGQDGSGFLVFALIGGKMAGADAAGGTLRGTYLQQESKLLVESELDLPEGATLATNGTTAGPGGIKIPVNFEIDDKLGNEKSVRIETGAGPLNLIIKKIMDL